MSQIGLLLPLTAIARQKHRDRVLADGEKDSFIALTGKGCHSKLMFCPWKGLGGSFIVWGVENRAADRDQGRGKLALSFKTDVQWSARLVLVVLLLSRMKKTSSTSSSICWGFQFCRKGSRILLYIFLKEETGPCPKAALLSLDCSSLVSSIPSLPWDQQLFEPALRNSGKVMQAEAYCLKARDRGHGKAYVPRSPTGPCMVTS